MRNLQNSTEKQKPNENFDFQKFNKSTLSSGTKAALEKVFYAAGLAGKIDHKDDYKVGMGVDAIRRHLTKSNSNWMYL